VKQRLAFVRCDKVQQLVYSGLMWIINICRNENKVLQPNRGSIQNSYIGKIIMRSHRTTTITCMTSTMMITRYAVPMAVTLFGLPCNFNIALMHRPTFVWLSRPWHFTIFYHLTYLLTYMTLTFHILTLHVLVMWSTRAELNRHQKKQYDKSLLL